MTKQRDGPTSADVSRPALMRSNRPTSGTIYDGADEIMTEPRLSRALSALIKSNGGNVTRFHAGIVYCAPTVLHINADRKPKAVIQFVFRSGTVL